MTPRLLELEIDNTAANVAMVAMSRGLVREADRFELRDLVRDALRRIVSRALVKQQFDPDEEQSE